MKAQKANRPQPSLRQSSVGTLLAALSFGLVTAGCSSSSGSNDEGAQIGAAVQDLNLDRDGRTVAVTVEGLVGLIDTGSVESSGGQNAVSIAMDGDRVLIMFDERVTPSHQIRLVGVEGVTEDFVNVTTSDPRVPLLNVLGATQDVSDDLLGGDQITVVFSNGPKVIREEAEDPQNWTLRVEGFELDLAGTVIGLNDATQVATLTLGPLANLHSSFSLVADVSTVADVPVNPSPQAATATGDSSAPSLEGATPVLQDLVVANDGDEFGRIISIDFDEPISPVFGAAASNFAVVNHPDAIGITSVTRVAVDTTDNTKVRLSFSRPIVPGLDQITIDGVVDAHGNAFPPQTVDLTAGSTVANSFANVSFNTVEGIDNDNVVAVLTQAIDPDTAEDPARWTLNIDSNPVTLAAEDISYDLASKSLTFNLGADFVNGLVADLTSVGAVDVDGDPFSLAADPVAAAGDAVAPTVLSLLQNRSVDASGQTVDVQFSEPLDVTTATNVASYDFDPAVAVDSATLVAGNTVRLALLDVVIPGDFTLTITQAVSDPAGNDLGGDVGPGPISSTDTVPATLISATAQAVEGAQNDVVFAFFNDSLIPAEAEDITRWSLESPVGTVQDLTGSTVAYNTLTGVATLTLGGSGAPSFLVGDSFQVFVTSVRDLGGNASDPMRIIGQAIGEQNRPSLEGIFVSGSAGNQISIRFSEPMLDPAGLFDPSSNPDGARYELIDPTTSNVTFPSSAAEVDLGLGVILTYASAVDAAATVNVVGLRDAAGNLLFPVLDVPIEGQDNTVPAQNGFPVLTAVEGTNNDTVTVTFNVPMSRYNLTNRDAYVLRNDSTGEEVDLSSATFDFDGVSTLSIGLVRAVGVSLDRSVNYSLALEPAGINSLRSLRGVELDATNTEAGVSVTGDIVNGPTLSGSNALVISSDPNALVVVFNETVQTAAALMAAEYNFGGGSVATSVSRLNDRSFFVSFAGPVSVGTTLDITATAAIDSAGNAASGTLSLTTADDVTAPFVTGVTATVNNGFGGDTIVVGFSEMIDADGDIPTERFAVTSNGATVGVAVASFDVQALTATLLVEDLVEGQTVSVAVTGLTDIVGNAPGAAMTGSALVAGDDVPPSIVVAFVNRQADDAGTTIDVEFSEAVQAAFATVGSNWTISTGETVTNAERISQDHVRLQLSAAIDSSATLTLAAGLTDSSGNAAPELVVDPTE